MRSSSCASTNIYNRRMEDISSKFTIAVIGRSVSGKGVQAHALLSLLGKRAYHMETGRFLREITREHENPTIRIARRLMGQGRLFPSWFSSYTWLNKFIAGGKADRHLIFDRAPRRLSRSEEHTSELQSQFHLV